MLRNARAAILALGLSACSTPAPLALAITDVHVVDVETGRVCRDRTILIVGDRITAVGDARRLPVPTGARVLAGDGAFVIPGLVDMHVRLPRGERALEAAFAAMLAAGVTTVRSVQGATGDPALRDAIASGARDGPRLIVASPPLDRGVADATEARTRVRAYAADGFDLIAVAELTDPTVYRAALDEAQRLGVAVGGYVPMVAGLRDAFDSHRLIDHLHVHRGAALHAPELLPALAHLAAGSQVGICACLSLVDSWQARGCMDRSEDWIVWSSLPPGRSVHDHPRPLPPAENLLVASYTALHELHVAGARLVVGSGGTGRDAAAEMRRMAEAGLPNLAVLRAATCEAAHSVGQAHDWGAIRAGLAADLVLLEADPLADLAAADDDGRGCGCGDR